LAQKFTKNITKRYGVDDCTQPAQPLVSRFVMLVALLPGRFRTHNLICSKTDIKLKFKSMKSFIFRDSVVSIQY